MTARKKPTRNEIRLTPPDKDMTEQEAFAWALVNTPVQAAVTVRSYLQEPFNGCLSELIGELKKQVDAINNGDMRKVEGLLVQQAHTLNIMFNRLAEQAKEQVSLPHFEACLKLALRAQSQCRATLEALSAIKNPPHVAFVSQANIAHQQQVNNGPQAGPPAMKESTPPLEYIHGHYLDSRTATTAIGENSAMATLGEVHRPKDR